MLVDEPDVVAAPAPDPAEIVLDRLSHVVVRRTFRVLPAQNRRLLEGIVADDRPSYASLSRALKMPIGSIGPTRRRSLEPLRRLLVDGAEWEWDVPA